MEMSKAFPSKWLKAADIKGSEVPVKIRCVEMGDVGSDDEPEQKPCLFFIGKDKGMVLNKTNTARLVETYGDESDNWNGAECILYVEKVSFKGGLVDAIRLRVPVPAPAEDGDDNVPF